MKLKQDESKSRWIKVNELKTRLIRDKMNRRRDE